MNLSSTFESPYYFDVTLSVDGRHSLTYSVIHLSEFSYSKQNLIHTIRSKLSLTFPPDRILIVCPSGLENHIQNLYEKIASSSIESNLVTSITVLPFGINGKLLKKSICHQIGNKWEISDDFLNQISKECIKQALPLTKTILEAPHGYKFQKPSGSDKRYFIRAGNMLSIPDLSLVFCRFILEIIPKDTRVIYIDSFTILSFALRLQSLIAYFSRQAKFSGAKVPRIVNFRSYEISDDFKFPKSKDYFVIISASTSGELAQKLIDDHKAKNTLMIHLLGFGCNENDLKNSSIYFEDRSENTVAMQDCEFISIHSEEFMMSPGPPKSVRLAENHVLKKEMDQIQNHFYNKFLHINRAGASSGYGPHSLFSIRYGKHEKFPKSLSNWINYRLVHEIPATVKTIVYLDDDESCILGKKIKCELQKKTDSNHIDLVSTSEFTNYLDNINCDSTIVIVGNDDPNLDKFRALSIELRSRPDLFRHFVICHAFPNSRSQYKRTVNDLRFAPEGSCNYGWSDFMVIPVGGSGLHGDILTDYGIDWRQPDQLTKEICKKIFKNERLQLSNVNSSSNLDLFFPTLSGEKLELRHGSIFLSLENDSKSEGNHSNLSQQVVYLAVASSLQKAREWSNTSNSNLKFDENPFIKTVIDPKMFDRFNDGIIQASLLRALKKSELDYSSDINLSRHFCRITKSVMKNSNEKEGEAVLEFLVAIAKKKVSLTDEDFDDIQSNANASQKLKLYWEFFLREAPL